MLLAQDLHQPDVSSEAKSVTSAILENATKHDTRDGMHRVSPQTIHCGWPAEGRNITRPIIRDLRYQALHKIGFVAQIPERQEPLLVYNPPHLKGMVKTGYQCENARGRRRRLSQNTKHYASAGSLHFSGVQ